MGAADGEVVHAGVLGGGAVFVAAGTVGDDFVELGGEWGGVESEGGGGGEENLQLLEFEMTSGSGVFETLVTTRAYNAFGEVAYEIDRITPENLAAVLGRHLDAGDICLDLAWNIDANVILQWCRDRGVRYLNTSLEVWDPYEDAAATPPLERTLYVRHMRMRRMIGSHACHEVFFSWKLL